MARTTRVASTGRRRVAVLLALVGSVAHMALAAPVPATAHRAGDCDPLVPEYCMAPFPNNFYLQPDAQTPTGQRIRLTTSMLPVANDGVPIDPADWQYLDGFSRLMPIVAYASGVSLDASVLPPNWDIGSSLRTDARSILLDTVTGERIAHWAELDLSSQGVRPDQQLLMMWPSGPLQFSRRYIVAYRNLRRDDGSVIPSSPAFVQLRDGVPSGDDDVESRRENYERNIFPNLANAGFARNELFLAWEFTVGSAEVTRQVLGTAAEDALARIPSGGPEYRILRVEDNISNFTARHIVGQFRVPFYLNQILPSAKLVLDDANRPVYQGDEWAPFSVIIPRNIADGEAPRGMLQFGHGLFQNHLVVLTEDLQIAANDLRIVLFATNMVGMSSRDAAAILEMLSTDVSNAAIVPHGCVQGVVNFLVMTKLLLGDFVNDERVQFNNRSAIRTDPRGYLGYSQGGIYGTTFLSLSKDIDEGIFGVPGGPFVLLLPRARPFAPYWSAIVNRYDDPRDRITLLSYMQLIWDVVDNMPWTDVLASNPRKRAQVVWAKGDAQVTYLGANNIARAIGARAFPNVVKGRDNETVYGIPTLSTDTTTEGHIVLGYNFEREDDEVPIYNIPPPGYDTHNDPYRQQSFVNRCALLVLEKYHAQLCQGPCGYDPVRPAERTD